MDQNSKTKIYFNKSRIAILLFVTVIFVALGVWFVADAFGTNAQLGNPLVKMLTGTASILFFGWLAFHFCKKVFNSTPAVIITEEGIVDNSSGTCAGFVPWSDIDGIKETKIGNRMFVNVVVKDPGLYINQQESGFKRRIMRMNYNANGTAIGISARGLQCTHNQLKQLLETKFLEFKKNNSPASRA